MKGRIRGPVEGTYLYGVLRCIGQNLVVAAVKVIVPPGKAYFRTVHWKMTAGQILIVFIVFISFS